MKKSNYIYVNPGGNPTALFTDKFARRDYGTIAKKLLRQKNPAIEQVGFLEQTKNPKAAIRLQMMGGEFCANALRSTAAILAIEKGSMPSQPNRNKLFSFVLESSGTKNLIKGSAKLNSRGQARWSAIELTVPMKRSSIQPATVSTNNADMAGELVQLEGITHLLLPARAFSKKSDYKKIIRQWYSDLKIAAPAFGIIFYKNISPQNLSIIPIVYVRATDSVFFETSCASGALATALAKTDAKKPVSVRQPSNSVLRISRPSNSRVKIEGEILSAETKQT